MLKFAKITFSSALLFLIGVGGCAAPETRPSVELPNYERMLDSTVHVWVRSLGTGRAVSYGSGVVVGPHTILTAGHVADGFADLNGPMTGEVVFRNGERVTATVEHFKWSYRFEAGQTFVARRDFAVLYVPTTFDYPRARVDCTLQSVGTRVYATGSPGLLKWALTEGRVVSVRKRWFQESPETWLRHDATIYRGMSGGPVFNRDGLIVGITSHFQPNLRGSSSGFDFAYAGPSMCRDLAKWEVLRDG